MPAKFTTIMYGSLEDLDSILDSQPMDEQELRAALQRILKEVNAQRRVIQRQGMRLEKLVSLHPNC